MPKRNLIWILILLALGGMLLFVWNQPGGNGTSAHTEFLGPEQTFKLIRENYYQPLDEQALQKGAIRGMVEQLDPFTTYAPPERVEALSQRIMGKQQGTGLVLAKPRQARELERPGVIILGTQHNSPAHKAGIVPGSCLLAIEGKKMSASQIDEARAALRGPQGQAVTLDILPPGETTPKRLTLKRASYPIETVQGLYRNPAGQWVYRVPTQATSATKAKGNHDGTLAYLRIVEFCPQTHQVLQQRLRELPSPRGLILDLRGNPGGFLDDGIAAADRFLREGRIVTIIGRGGKLTTRHAHNDGPYAQVPMIVLIDANTASAAEMVAGALAANARAILLGERTRGKGCVQSLFPLPKGLGQLNLTTAEFLLDPDWPVQRYPNANTWGIEPNVPIAARDEARRERQRRQNVLRVMPGPHGETLDTPDPRQRDAYLRETIQGDAALTEAIELLHSRTQYDAILSRLARDVPKRQKRWTQWERDWKARHDKAKKTASPSRDHDDKDSTDDR